ncbi:PspA/IM30 family protein [Candidatus Reidiella endopervernicosa]|uniref:PspA/IM30 family protein n=1 Tax=Candidatus Reidiella endopervernicosa TaxID=2738883 RepID=A0A6N0HWY4_9GAMM|nr:PspA/IM30 family protein [Candidatus Reidiella endopervernicosa]QKQ26842.1 PspA/IM30 family protein [Candidatus Reidiella endopervernicosa]
MALINRVTRLFRADMHAVLDRIEEPEVLLRQSIREMEEALADDEQQLRQLIEEGEQIAERVEILQQALVEIDAELDLCIDADKDDLARSLIKRKLESQRLEGVIEQRAESLQRQIVERKRDAEENRATLESMRQKAELLDNQRQTVNGATEWSAPDQSVLDEEIEIALLREKERRSHS